MNVVCLLGNLTQDPNAKYSKDGKAYCGFTVAVQRKFKNKTTGQYEADFVLCYAFDKTAEFVAQHFFKGSKIAVQGSWQHESYTDKEGVKKYSDKCIVHQVSFAGSKSTAAADGSTVANQEAPVEPPQDYQSNTEVPF